MKKINLIIASLLLLSGVIFYSCTKDENINNSQNSQNKPFVNNNKETRGIERLFDEQYVQQLITVSGVDPKKLSQDFAIWNPFYNGLRAINACFTNKYIYFLENASFNGNAAYCLNHLNQSRDYFAAGDTLNGLIAANQAYNLAGCGSLTPFFYRNHSFDIPVSQIAQDIRVYENAMGILTNKYPNLNKIDEQYKRDIFILAILHTEFDGKKAVSCEVALAAESAEAALVAGACSELSMGLVWPPAIVAGLIGCASLYAYKLYVAHENYHACLQGQ